MSDNRAIMHVLSHTHWDREWYQEFQGYRQRLVYQIDALMDLLEKRPEYRHFHLDGQTSCVLDYLEMRPESRERLLGHIRSGRILVGPWFVMPDELLLSGESLVRNLLRGHRLCAEWGVEPMRVGYVTDIFGHCSQFPQILHGFGIDVAILHRGTSNEDEKSEMVWEGADGSEVLLIKVYPHTGYQDFLQYREASEEVLLEYERRKLELATTNVLFALDGNDHQPAYWNIPELIGRVNGVFTRVRCVHSSIPAYLADLRAAMGPGWQEGRKRFRGELRRPNKGGMYAEVFHGTASSRVYLKQENDRLEWLLSRCAEPMHAWSVLLGGDSQKPFLDLAWRYLLLNHPHDSIVGCSIDQVHRDMMYRFDQARLIAQNSIWESAFAIGDRLDTTGDGPVVTVHNQASVERGPVVRFWFYVPEPLLEEKAKEGLVPALVDEQGRPVFCRMEEAGREPFPIPFVRKTREGTPMFAWMPDALVTHVRFDVAAAASVPALGYRSWRIGFVPKREIGAVRLPDGLQPVSADRERRAIENEFLRLEARDDGLIDLLDKSTGIQYRGLHELEDCGDTGSGWDHAYPERDTVVRSTGRGARAATAVGAKDSDHAALPSLQGASSESFAPTGPARGPVRIRIVRRSPLSASVDVGYRIKVPAGLTPGRGERTKRTVGLDVRTTFTLDAGSRRVECRTTIRNTARNHRVRVLFPTGRKTDVWQCDTAYDLVIRQIKLIDTTGWQEQDREESPIKNFAAVSDERGGLAVLTKGLCEACVRDDEQRTLALTLFRGFEQRIGGTRTVDSQMLGEVVCEYALRPFDPGAPAVELFREVEDYKMPLVPLTTPAHSGDLPPTGSFANVEGNMVLSTIKTSEDGSATVIRLFNPSEQDQVVSIALAVPFGQVWKCDLLEAPLSRVPLGDSGSFAFTARGKEIVTLRVQPEQVHG